MKIITWNCNMAFRKKAGFILNHRPDILIVPECEHPDKLIFDSGTPKPADSLWFGDNVHKGLGIFSYGKYRFKLSDLYNNSFKMVIPIVVSGGEAVFHIFAIWAHNPSDPDGQYITQIWKAIHYYDALLSQEPAILIGDFNSNTIWDKPKREGNHSTVVQQLKAKGITSVYHQHFKQNQGNEQHPTFYLYRKKDKPYHLDYCFVSTDFSARLKSVEIGDFDCWCQYSDHVPVMVEFKKIRMKKAKVLKNQP
jgi:exodeoxyribonuclease III